MSQTQTESKPTAADVQPAVFVRMAAVVRMTGLGRSTIYRLMAECWRRSARCPSRRFNEAEARTPQRR